MLFRSKGGTSRSPLTWWIYELAVIQRNALLRKQDNSVSVLKCLLLFVHLEIKVFDVLSVGNCQL